MLMVGEKECVPTAGRTNASWCAAIVDTLQADNNFEKLLVCPTREDMGSPISF